MTKEEQQERGEPISIRYYTYRGYPIKEELICCYNLSTGYVTVCRSPDVRASVNGISSVILDLAGYGSFVAAIFNSAVNTCEAYMGATGTTPVNGCYADYIQIKMNYDICTKYTYIDLGFGDGYRLGAVTQQVRLIETGVLQYYADDSGGREVTTHISQDKTYESEHFRNPAQMAVTNSYAPWVERISAKIYQHPIIF